MFLNFVLKEHLSLNFKMHIYSYVEDSRLSNVRGIVKIEGITPKTFI